MEKNKFFENYQEKVSQNVQIMTHGLIENRSNKKIGSKWDSTKIANKKSE
jgi:hypothetical protein